MANPNEAPKAFRVIRIQASNIKRLVAVDLTPNKYITRITGKNGSGKSSVLDGLDWAISSQGGRNVPKSPVRKGAQRGTYRVELGKDSKTEVIIRREFTEGGAKRAGREFIQVMPGFDGSALEAGKRQAIKTPEELQNQLLNLMGFDPLEFIHMEPTKQYHVLRAITIHDIDLDELDLRIAETAKARTEAGREVDRLAGAVRSIEVIPDLPTEKISESALIQKLTDAGQYNADIDRQQRERDSETRRLYTLKEDSERLWKQIEELTFQAKLKDSELAELSKKVDKFPALPEKQDPAAIQAEIKQAQIINGQIAKAQERATLAAEHKKAEAAWQVLEDQIKEDERRKKEAIANAKYPIAGLGFGTKEVLYNNLPFEQASNAEKIEVSMAIGMQANPAIRVMVIRDGSMLDSASMDLVARLAHENDYQVIVEAVDESGNIGIYLEEGEVKKVNPEPLDEPPLLAEMEKPAKKTRAKKSKK